VFERCGRQQAPLRAFAQPGRMNKHSGKIS
jgi:hypothetical protein